jgi:hypothetical protein
VEKKAALAKCQDDIAGADFRKRSSLDLSYVAGPE